MAKLTVADSEQANNKTSSRGGGRRARLWLSEAQAALTWAVILALIALLGAIYLYQASRTATTGRRVQRLQNELDTIKRDNAELERGVAEGQALDQLQERARNLGFVRAEPDDIEYLVVPNVPAKTASTPAPEATPQPEPIETMREAIWQALQASIGDLIRGESP